jgi:gliding motility-associated-like protein
MTNPNSVNSNTNAVISGTGPSKCWGETGSAVYRADVTSQISGNGNYTINLTGFSNPTWEVDGITLFIIYKDPGATYQGNMVINDGNITGIGSASSQTMNFTAACGNSTTCTAFLIQSDMQSNINGNQHPSTLNGLLGNFPNTFWCFDATTSTSVSSGQNTSNFGTDGLGADCYTWGVMGLYFQTSCSTCVPSSPNPINLNMSFVNASCGQNNGSATANASGGIPPYTYSWIPGGQTTQTITGIGGGTYVVIVSDSLGCVAAVDTVVLGGIAPNANFTFSNPAGCANLCNVFSDNSSPNCTNIFWDFGDGNNSTQSNPTHCYTQAGTFSVTMICTDASGCADTVVQNNIITVYPVPTASFTVSPGTVIVNPPNTPIQVCFTNTSANSNFYSWDFGDAGNADTSYSTDPCYTFNDTGVFCVNLISVSAQGCVDTTYTCVTIIPDFQIIYPNVVTPNGDNVNDIWHATSVGLKDIDVRIYNRWGEIVYEYTGITGGWNGKNNSGKMCSDGTYYFVAVATGITNEIKEEKGFIELIDSH